ncbi:MAG: pyridoxal-phosphate dependent enzyme, partial [archaeon]|nr:pyridoxal-phosphate dependent enzyme [archaeon]
MNSKMKLNCIECDKSYSAEEIRYKCDCGDLLEVAIDFEAIGKNAYDWKTSFDENKNKSAFIRYKEFLLPDLPDKKIISLGEGDTPLYNASEKVQGYFGVKNLFFKHEGMNPTLSFKDRGMVAGVSWANHLGVERVACASTGDTSAAMAAYASNAGIKPIVLLPDEKISFEQLSQAISYGAITLGLKTDFDGCMKTVQELTSKHNIYLLNSMNSIRIEGQKA